MDLRQSRRVLVAVDTNVLLDVAGAVEDVTDAVLVIQRRLFRPQFLMTPTVREELAEEALNSDNFHDRERAQRAFRFARAWSFQPIDLVEAQLDRARHIGRALRRSGLLPMEEVNDGLIVSESAIIGCSLLLTSDGHMRGMDFERLTLGLQPFGLAAPIVATPREIVRKFFQ